MKIEYKSKLVAFIDVLGFKNLVFGTTTDRIDTYYTFLLSNFKAAVAQRNFDYLLISDSIVIYCNDDLENLTELVKMINILQTGLLAKGILIRGAISHGELFVDKSNNIVVGTGLINAYNLEAQARFPRTILDRSLIGRYYASMNEAVSRNTVGGLPHLTLRPLNGHQIDFPYLNYGRILSTYVSNKPFEGALTLLRDNYYKNDQTEKFEWLKNHLIVSLEDQQAHLQALPVPSPNEKKRLKLALKYIPLLCGL